MSTTVFAAEGSQDSAYYQVGEPVIQEISWEILEQPLRPPMPPQASSKASSRNLNDLFLLQKVPAPSSVPLLREAEVVVDRIVNIGRKVWNVVEAGRPVVQTKGSSSNALPSGVTATNWAAMTGWSPPQSRTFQVIYKNGWGSTVVDFTFRLLYVTGGQYMGQGRYIADVTIVPAALDVAWGYNFASVAEVTSITNLGTTASPKAGLQVNVKWTVKTAFRHVERTESFYITGDGEFTQLN